MKINVQKLKIIKAHVHEVITVCNTEVKEIEKSETKNDKKIDENNNDDDDQEDEYDDDDDDDDDINDDSKRDVKPKIETKVRMTRIEEIESHKEIIDLLYKDYLQNPSFNEFTNLFRNIKTKSKAEKEIQVDSLIAEGNLIFHLNQ